MKKKILIAMATMTALFIFAQLVSANPLLRWSEVLGLSPKQEQKIKDILFQSKKEMIMLKAKLQLAKLELQQLLDQYKPDPDKVIKALEKVAQAKLELRKKQMLMMLKIRSVLTPEQFKKYKQVRRKRWQQRRKWMRKRWMQRRWMREKWMQNNWMNRGQETQNKESTTSPNNSQ